MLALRVEGEREMSWDDDKGEGGGEPSMAMSSTAMIPRPRPVSARDSSSIFPVMASPAM